MTVRGCRSPFPTTHALAVSDTIPIPIPKESHFDKGEAASFPRSGWYADFPAVPRLCDVCSDKGFEDERDMDDHPSEEPKDTAPRTAPHQVLALSDESLDTIRIDDTMFLMEI